MLRIIDDKIYMVRGDDAFISLELADENGDAYQMQPGDVLCLSVREFPDVTSELVFSATSASGDNRIFIGHEYTREKECGAYSADIQLMYADGCRDTIWPSDLERKSRLEKNRNWKNFMLCTEVTIL